MDAPVVHAGNPKIQTQLVWARQRQIELHNGIEWISALLCQIDSDALMLPFDLGRDV